MPVFPHLTLETMSTANGYALKLSSIVTLVLLNQLLSYLLNLALALDPSTLLSTWLEKEDPKLSIS